ncbi:MAG: HEAT repeat domain-containing protein [Spirochaetes bacterium]|jgi:HEAT repeat protein|nr:HEAT repeat domain-containing protein [Spirochaetota bacterium]
MFNRFRAQWYYSRLEHSKGERFITAVSRLASIDSPLTVPFLLDILITRNDLTLSEKAPLAEAFASIGPVATRFLLNSIYDENGLIRYGVVAALGHTKEKEAVPLFIFLLEQSDDPIFAKALGDIGSVDAQDVLRSVINHSGSHCRLEALEALGKILMKDNISVFIGLLRDDDSALRNRAAGFLKQLSYSFENPVDEMLCNAIRSDWDNVRVTDPEGARALLHFVDRSDEILCERIFEKVTESVFDHQSDVFREYLEQLPGELKRGFLDMVDSAPEELFDLLIGFLTSSNLHLKRSSEKLLCRSGINAGKKAMDILLSGAVNSELERTSLICVATETLCSQTEFVAESIKKGTDETLPALLEIAAECGNKRLSPEIRDLFNRNLTDELLLCIIYALGELEDKQSVSKISEYLCHNDRDIRIAVYDALRKIGDTSVYDSLCDVLDNVCDDEELSILKDTLRELENETS